MGERLGILWLVFDEASSSRLRTAVPPKFAQVFCHHITLLYGVPRQAVEKYIDKLATITAYTNSHNDKAQACRVQTAGLPDTYGAPHVTVSTAPGIPPFASVAMLQSEHVEVTLDTPVQLHGTLRFIYIDQVVE